MRRTILHIFFAALVLLAFGSCEPELQPEGVVSISFSTGEIETKSDADDVADGGKIYLNLNGDNPDLTVLICSGNTIKAVYSNNGAGSAVITGGSYTGSLQSKSGSTATVRFANLPQGSYTVYVLANTGGLWPMTNGSNTVAASGITAANIENLYFNPASVPPAVLNGRMPLTAKGTLTVNASHNGTVSLTLKRCVARVKVYLVNNYGSALTLTTYHCYIHGINPGNGYLIPHSSDYISANPGDLSFSGSVEPLNDEQTHTLSELVYPSSTTATGYTCSIDLTINNHTYEWQNLAITDEYAQRVTSLARNQQLGITIRIGKGKMVSFNFSVEDWNEDSLTQEIHFD